MQLSLIMGILNDLIWEGCANVKMPGEAILIGGLHAISNFRERSLVDKMRCLAIYPMCDQERVFCAILSLLLLQNWPERSQHLSHLPGPPVRLCSLAIALAGWISTHWTLAHCQEKLRDRPLTLTLHPLISELRPICLKLRPRNLECWPLNSKTWPFYSKNAAQNPNCRANCSNLQALSLNCQPSNSTCQSNSYTPAPAPSPSEIFEQIAIPFPLQPHLAIEVG